MSSDSILSEPPLDHPWYGIGFGAAVKRFFKKYATFDGRASRGEYWWVVLFTLLVVVVLYALIGLSVAVGSGSDGQPGPLAFAVGGLFTLFYLGILVPTIAVAVRRLHDTGKSGWTYLICLIPLVGPIILVVLLASATAPDAERFGPPRSQPFYGYGPGQPPSQGYGTQ